jgi:hypothetical protein
MAGGDVLLNPYSARQTSIRPSTFMPKPDKDSSTTAQAK